MNYDSILIQAASKGDTKLLKEMLQKGATDIQMAMIVSLQFGHANIVQWLFEKGLVDLNTARYYASNSSNEMMDFVKVCLSKLQ